MGVPSLRAEEEVEAFLPVGAADEATAALLTALPTRLRSFLDYWQSKRLPGRPVPLRSAFDPVDLPRHLHAVVLIEVVHLPERGRSYRWRVAGSDFRQRLGREITGNFVHEVFSPDDAAVMEARYADILDKGCPHFLRQVSRLPDHEFVGFQRIMAPLSSDGESADYLVGCWYWETDD